MTNLLAAVALGGIYSFVMALSLLTLDAVDVSMTEASVGAGISTVLLLGALYLTTAQERPSPGGGSIMAMVVSLIAGVGLLYGAWGLPSFGDPSAPIHHHVAPRYINDVMRETGVPNIVTAVLASYRGYDTLGETTVIFTAGIGVLLLLKGRRRRPDDAETRP